MADPNLITLWQGEAAAADVKLRAPPVADAVTTTIWLWPEYAYNPSPSADIQLLDPTQTPPPFVQFTGQHATSAAGTLIAEIDALPAGQVATTVQGALVPLITVALTGQLATSAAGVIVPEIGALLVGQIATTAEGTLIPAIDVALTGQVATTAEGTIVPLISVLLTGQVATTAEGTLTPTTDFGTALTGLAATSAAGTLIPLIDVVLTGGVATSAQGTLIPAIAVTLLGSGAATSEGTIVPAIAVTLTGQQATTAQGICGPQKDITVNVTGVEAALLLGNVTAFVTKNKIRQVDVWARTQVAELIAQLESNSLYVTMEPTPEQARVDFAELFYQNDSIELLADTVDIGLIAEYDAVALFVVKLPEQLNTQLTANVLTTQRE